MLMLFFWLVLTLLTIIVLMVSFPDKTVDILTNLKRQLHKRYARRYGQAAADQRFPLHPWEQHPSEPKPKPTLEQLYASQYGYFFRYFLGLDSPAAGLKISKREALRLSIIGFLIRWGLAKIRSTRT